MKYPNVKVLQIGEQCSLFTKDFDKVTSEVLAKRVSSYSATLRQSEDEIYKNFRIRTLTTPVGIIVTRIS